MDLKSFRVGLEAARRFEAASQGVTFQLRMPTEHAWRVAFESHRDAHGQVMYAQAFRRILEEAVTGWSGLKASHLQAGGGEAELPFSAEARALLLEERHDIVDELVKAITAKVLERRGQLEEERKNS